MFQQVINKLQLHIIYILIEHKAEWFNLIRVIIDFWGRDKTQTHTPSYCLTTTMNFIDLMKMFLLMKYMKITYLIFGFSIENLQLRTSNNIINNFINNSIFALCQMGCKKKHFCNNTKKKPIGSGN